MFLKSVQLLSDALTGKPIPVDAELKNVFLAGFLESESRLPTDLATFNEAAEGFLARAKLPADLWTRFLGLLVDEALATDETMQPRMLAYFAIQAAEVCSMLQVPAAAAPGAPVFLPLATSAGDMKMIETLLARKKPLPDRPLGDILMSWPAPLPGAVDRFQVDLVNCEGGPALLVYHFAGPRVINSTPPRYDPRAILGEFEVRGVRYQLGLRAESAAP